MLPTALLAIALLGADASATDPATLPWQARLFTPTLLDKVGDTYFIVDCWHHRVLWNRTLDSDIARWNVLDDTLAGPHSIASDGTFYVVDDTGRNAVRVYRRRGERFERVETIDGLSERPHRVRYDADTKAFYVLAADSQDLYKLVRRQDRLDLVYKKHMDFLEGKYTRSFTIADGLMYFVSGPGSIHKVAFRDDSFAVIAKYAIPAEFGGMNDLFRTTDGWWYLTASYLKAARVRNLDDLAGGKLEDVHPQIGLGATPYYMSRVDGRYFAPIINERNAIVSFAHDEKGKIADMQVLCDFGRENKADADRFKELPK